MNHLLEILKIVEGGVAADRTKVIAYTSQLVKKLLAENEKEAAKKIQHLIGNSKDGGTVAPAFLNSSLRLPVDNESRFTLAEESHIQQGDVNVFLSKKVDSTILEFLRNIKATGRLLAMGIDVHPSLLMYGPSGCGKTELARYIASELQLPLLTARTDAIISSFLGSTSKNIRTLFDHATARPCVLFLDEFDSIAKLRDDQHELGELKRVVISLLQNIDALRQKTVLLAATNHEHLLDAAVWRRFAYKIQVEKPDLEARKKLFLHFLAKFDKEKNAVNYASLTEGFSGSEIRQLAEDAKRESALNGRDTVLQEEVLQRILNMRLQGKLVGGESNLSQQIKMARELNPKVFTVRRLAKIFECSTGQVSKLINKSE